MQIKSQSVVALSNKDLYILITTDGKCAMNGKFIDLLVMSIGIWAVLYENGTSNNRKFLKNEVPKIIKKLAENDFNPNKIDL